MKIVFNLLFLSVVSRDWSSDIKHPIQEIPSLIPSNLSNRNDIQSELQAFNI